MRKSLLYFAWSISLIATGTSLYVSNVLHWEPCILCWYQRILLFPLVIILAVGILRDTQDIEYFVLPMTILGMSVSAYHYLLLTGIIPEKLAPCTSGVSCLIPYHLFFNFLNIPLLSFLAFASITLCVTIYDRKIKI